MRSEALPPEWPADASCRDRPLRILLVAPRDGRTRGGRMGRRLAEAWQRAGVPLRLVCSDLPNATRPVFHVPRIPIQEGPLAVIFVQGPHPAWLSIELPPGSLRILVPSPAAQPRDLPTWAIHACNAMDQVWLADDVEAAAWIRAGVHPGRVHLLPLNAGVGPSSSPDTLPGHQPPPPGPCPSSPMVAALQEGLQCAVRRSLAPSQGMLSVRWEGSWFTHHSLAHVNRQLCLGLLDSQQVSLSLLPFEADAFDGAALPAYRPLAERMFAPLPGPATVHVRHQWPPRFDPPPQGAWVMIQPWEFGGIPREWVAPMVRGVDEIWAYTTWVRDCYIESGVPPDKVVVVPLGVDTERFRPEGGRFPLATRKGFRFLFLGGLVDRKGIDVLLRAYGRAFRRDDDVCLVVKGQAGTTYQGKEPPEVLLARQRTDPDFPETEFVTEALDEDALASLYRACDVFALPYRGEGFGLPLAEALASGLPLLTTAAGAARDFLSEAWAYLLPSRPRPLRCVDNYLPSRAGFWLEEPDEDTLVRLLRQVYEHPGEAREKGSRARKHALAALGWEPAVQRVVERLRILADRTPSRQLSHGPCLPLQEAFLLEPDWSGARWMEVVLAYLEAFSPGEPVALVLAYDAALATQPRPERAREAILQLVSRAGRTTFPDVILVDDPQELPDILSRFSAVHSVPSSPEGPAGPGGGYAGRLAWSRARLAGITGPDR